jgi:hypothetical protein
MTTSRVQAVAVAASFFLFGVVLAFHPATRAQDAGTAAAPVVCNEQQPQDFLVRGNWVTKARMPPEEIRARRAVHQHAIRYRTETYGHFAGFGEEAWNPHPPSFFARGITAFGLRVRLNERIIPAVRCAEQAVALNCGATPYTPHRLSGIRDRNTYHNGEVSNHVFGIALDIDPDLNTCCHCVAEWAEAPLCRREVSSIFERMAMPECWVTQFERYGFYWLGHDTLEDTMHFEFLGDPDHIVRAD